MRPYVPGNTLVLMFSSTRPTQTSRKNKTENVLKCHLIEMMINIFIYMVGLECV